MDSPLTPQQALSNFKLLLELSPRNNPEAYQFAVREIADIVISLGIQGDDQHPQPICPALTHAADLLTDIMQDKVNAKDEAEKWLRAYAPKHLTATYLPASPETPDSSISH